MKKIVLDTETTGLSVKDGHRIVEIGCIELEKNFISAINNAGFPELKFNKKVDFENLYKKNKN